MGCIRELLDGKIWEWDLSFRWEWEWGGNGNEVIEMGGNWYEKSVPAHLYCEHAFTQCERDVVVPLTDLRCRRLGPRRTRLRSLRSGRRRTPSGCTSAKTCTGTASPGLDTGCRRLAYLHRHTRRQSSSLLFSRHKTHSV